ncbi:MAG: TIGR04086 family membrane protein [Clostridia bacterium]|nr:TIGR04086 family membrane protein [Clostridia bacterium]
MIERKNIMFLLVKGILLTYILNVLFLFVYAVVLSYTNVAESTIPTVIFVINLLGVFISSSIFAIKIKANGMKYGGLLGFLYIIILYLLGAFTSIGFGLTSYSLATIIFNILIGMVGGVIGVNLAKN